MSGNCFDFIHLNSELCGCPTGSRGQDLCLATVITAIFAQAKNELMKDHKKTKLTVVQSLGRVMIDPVVFQMYNAHSLLAPSVLRIKNPLTMSDDDYLICSSMALGYSFGSKQWGAFPLACLQDIHWNSTAFDKVVLKPQHAKIIYASVKAHSAGQSQFDDIVPNKGMAPIFSGPASFYGTD